MLRVRTVATGVAGSPWYVNMHFEDGTAQSAANQVEAFWDALRAQLSSAVTYQVAGEVGVIDPITGELEDVTAVDTEPIQGGGVTALAPTATQGLVRINTNDVFNNRRTQGRIFVPGVTPATVGAAGVPTPTFVTALQSAAGLLADVATPPRIGVYSPPRTFDGTILTPGRFSVASGVLARTKFAVLRSRRD